jgi:hypothetical protein
MGMRAMYSQVSVPKARTRTPATLLRRGSELPARQAFCRVFLCHFSATLALILECPGTNLVFWRTL